MREYLIDSLRRRLPTYNRGEWVKKSPPTVWIHQHIVYITLLIVLSQIYILLFVLTYIFHLVIHDNSPNHRQIYVETNETRAPFSTLSIFFVF